jgi:hypothetical protein
VSRLPDGVNLRARYEEARTQIAGLGEQRRQLEARLDELTNHIADDETRYGATYPDQTADLVAGNPATRSAVCSPVRTVGGSAFRTMSD